MESREVPEGKATVSGEGRDLVGAINAAAEALGVEPANVGYKVDLSHFRSQSGGMVAKHTVKIVGWVEEGGAHLERVAAPAGGGRSEGRRDERRGRDRDRDRDDKDRKHKKGKRDRRDERPHKEAASERRGDDKPRSTTEASELAKGWFAALLDHMGIEGQVEATGDEGRVYLDVTAERAGRVIGKRGSTLRAIRFFLQKTLEAHGDPELSIDVEDPRPKDKKGSGRDRDRGRGRDRDRDRKGRRADKGEYPEAKLRALATRAAEKAVDSGKTVTINLELNSYDRRIVHLAVSEIDGVFSESEEKDGVKYVQVIPSAEE